MDGSAVKRLILASASPRRRALLTRAGYAFAERKVNKVQAYISACMTPMETERTNA